MNPKVILKDLSPVRKEIEVVVAREDVVSQLDEVYRRIAKKAKIKGFRPGKVPRSVLEQYYRQDAESDAVRDLVQKSYPEALREAGVMPIAPPDIRVTAFSAEQDFAYSASVEVPPRFEVKGYQGLSLNKDKAEVTDQEIQDNLKALQDRMTQLVPAPELRKTRKDDVITLDYQAYHDGQPVTGFQGKGFLVELGKGYLFPEIETGLVDVLPGEKKRIEVTLPDNWADKNLAGKTVGYEVEVKEIKEKKVPELNDDFAKDLGQFATLEEVKNKVREDVAKAKEQAAKNKMRRELLEKLIQANEFPVPEAMIRIELDDMLKRFEGNLRNQGLTLQQAGVTAEDFAAKNRDEAVFRVKGALIFDAIARKEGVTVTAEEVDKRIEDMATQAKQPAASWKKYFKDNHMLGRVEGALLEEKALDFVLSHSKIKGKTL